MSRILSLVYETFLIVAAVLLGRYLSAHVHLIPRAILRFPDITYTEDDFRKVLVAFVVVNLAVFASASLIAGRNLFTEARRVAFEIYAFIFGFTLTAIYLFLFADIIFSPELMLGIALSGIALFLLSYMVGSQFRRVRRRNPIIALFEVVGATFGLLRSPIAILIVLFALSPAVAAYAFISSRDFANVVTRIRLQFASTETGKYQLTSAFPGVIFHQPINIQFPPEGSPNIYVLERAGKLWRMGKDGTAKELLLDFSNRVGVVEVENGAIGFALHPEFGRTGSPNHGFVYAYYTDSTMPGHQINRLVRFNLDLPSPEERAASETPLVEFGRNPEGFHNAGTVNFGPDGFLYFSIGEAQNAANHQRIDMNPLAGIFRIDVDQRGGDVSHSIPKQPMNGRTQNYFIPNDNPFVGVPGALEEYWALGLRNPFRFSFDQDGTLWAGDVGSDEWEEVNVIEKGGNYQYPYIEGVSPSRSLRDAKPANIIGTEHGPVYFYHHSARDRAVTGGVVYRGNKLPELRGQYIFADSYSGRVVSFPATERHVDNVTFLTRSIQVAQNGLVQVANTPDGDLYLVVLGAASQPTGEIVKVVPAGSAPAQIIPHEAGAAIAAADGHEVFSASCSRCHGVRGDGDSPDAANLPVKPPNFTDPNYPMKRTLAQVESIVRRGGAASGLNAVMPSWEGVLTDPEIKAVAAYVYGLSQKH
jgi:glucose/arabinose dehydrogenase